MVMDTPDNIALITDPPYGIEYSSGHGSDDWGDGAVSGDIDTSIRDKVLKETDGMTALVFGSWKSIRPAGTKMVLIWDTLGALGMGDLRLPWKPSHQEIYVLGNPDGFCGSRDSDVLRCPPVQSMAKNGRLHPMEKPVALMKMLISKTNADTVFDPFMGSGTTGVACMQLGRNFIGCEIDPKYFEIAQKRIEAAQAQMVMPL